MSSRANRTRMNILDDFKFRLSSARHAHQLDAELKRLRQHNERLRQEAHDIKASPSNINPKNVVWIFGTGRTGSSWLWRMLVSQGHSVGWNEPYAGAVFRHLDAAENLKKRKETIFGEFYREAWRESVKDMLLRCAAARFPHMSKDQFLIIKEPNGSSGAPWLTEALPESRVILLIRDPRDVVASAIDSVKPGAWRSYSPQSRTPVEKLIRTRAQTYCNHINAAYTAFDRHEGSKSLISYEELMVDTLTTLRRLCRDIELPFTEGIETAVEQHSWQNVPDERKGPGKAMRKATPGGWREDLRDDQVRTVERITGNLMDRFGYKKIT